MSALQWALLIFGVVAVIAIYFYSRRESRSGDVFGPEGADSRDAELRPRGPASPFDRQMDIFGSAGEFDDFGVGRARRVVSEFDADDGRHAGHEDDRMPHDDDDFHAVMKRVPPRIADYQPDDDAVEPIPALRPERRPPARSPEPRADSRPDSRVSPRVGTESGHAGNNVAGMTTSRGAATPTSDRGAYERPIVDRAAQERANERAAERVAAPAPQEKLVSLLIAEREGAHILGEDLHVALREQGLEYGFRQVYHRVVNGQPVFSVASLLKPGVLDPSQAKGFATPGLAIFMVLPGPLAPLDAFQDMLKTAQALAGSLNAEVYDSRKKPLTTASILVLRSDVDAWAQIHGRN